LKNKAKIVRDGYFRPIVGSNWPVSFPAVVETSWHEKCSVFYSSQKYTSFSEKQKC
jgi:hypothetical protein